MGHPASQAVLVGRKFVLITDSSALLWLFKSQALSSKLHRWALRLMEYDMDLHWRPGANHQLPETLSRLPLSDTRRERILTTHSQTIPLPKPRLEAPGDR